MTATRSYNSHNRFYIYRLMLLWITLFCCITSVTLSQDIHFAQFMYSPLNQNPAKTGLFDGDYRIVANHREQWNSVTVPYKTFSASFDMVLSGFSNEKNRLATGLLVNSDKAGDSDFGTFDGELSFSWQHRPGRDSTHLISGGLQAGMVQRSISYNRLTFDNQFNGDVFDPNSSPGENFEKSTFYYFNISAGLAWEYMINKTHTIGAGVSLQHINKPVQTFFEEKNVRLPMRLQINLNSNIRLTERLNLLPDVIWMKQNTFRELVLGGQFRYMLSDKPGKVYNLYLGLEGRIKDAIIPMVGLDYNTLHAGISYDINTSGLKKASHGKGGLELAIVYIIKKVKPEGIKPPCVIY